MHTQEEFNADTDELINKICVTFHDELKTLADKYGNVGVYVRVEE